MLANDYGVYDGLVPVMLPALGDTGAAHLKSRLAQVLIDRSKAGERDGRAEASRRALQDIADGQGDVDAYMALVPTAGRSNPHTGAEIGRRLLAAGRAVEALAALEFARPKRRAVRATEDDARSLAGHGAHGVWEEAYIRPCPARSQQLALFAGASRGEIY